MLELICLVNKPQPFKSKLIYPARIRFFSIIIIFNSNLFNLATTSPDWMLVILSEYFVLDKIICNVYITLYLAGSSVVFINFFPTQTVVNAIIRISWPLVEACVTEWLTPQTPDVKVRSSSLGHPSSCFPRQGTLLHFGPLHIGV